MHHVIESDGNVRAMSAHGAGNIESTLVHQFEQQGKRADNLVYICAFAVNGQAVVFQTSLCHVALVAIRVVSRAKVDDDLYTDITNFPNSQLLPRPDIVLPLTPLS